MNKQQINEKYFCKNLLGKTGGFTLVELIIVITILAILATIAFVSFKNYAGNARDGNRIATLSNIQKWLDLYQIKASNYPLPEDTYGTGIYINNWEEVELTYVWLIKNNISKVINMNTIPLDPKTSNNYIYWINYNQKYYQIATVLENNISYNIFPITYANTNYQAKVNGNYQWLIIKNNTIYNIPSLIFSNTWTIFLTGSVFFIADTSDNLPYPIDNANSQNSNTQKILQLVTGKPALSITWIIRPETPEQFEENKEIYSKLWYNLNTVWKTIFWEKYKWNFPEDEENNTILEDCIFWEENTSGSIFWACSL